jgi:SAM-dependent methyltransferase
MSEPSTFDLQYAARQLDRRSNGFRARIKQFYLDRVLRHVRGPTLDIGCGAGQLLERLPPGSIGLEVNPALVADLQARGLRVELVVPTTNALALGSVRPGDVKTAVLSHVLEHFDDAAAVLRRLFDDCAARGIERVVVVVPGLVGYRSDATHRTFVTLAYLRAHGLVSAQAGGGGFHLVHHSYFPGNLRFIGRLFVYHELMLVYDLNKS